MATLRVLDTSPVEDEELWSQQEGESDKAYAAFLLYRDMPKRSMRVLAASIALQQKRGETTVLRQLEEWSRTRNWRERVRLFDAQRERELRAEVMERHKSTLRAAMSVLAHPLGAAVELMQREPLLGVQLAEEVERAAQMGRGLAAYERLMSVVGRSSETLARLATVERLVHGLSTENVAEAQDDDSNGAAERAATDPAFVAGLRELIHRTRGAS